MPWKVKSYSLYMGDPAPSHSRRLANRAEYVPTDLGSESLAKFSHDHDATFQNELEVMSNESL